MHREHETPAPEDATVTLAHLLHRLVGSCDCGQFDNDDLHAARELVWRMAAHGLVFVDVDYLDAISGDNN